MDNILKQFELPSYDDLIFENTLSFDDLKQELLLEAADAKKENIFQKIWNMIMKALEFLVKQVQNFTKSLISKFKKNKKPADSIANDAGIKPNTQPNTQPAEPDNSPVTAIEGTGDIEKDIEIIQTNKSSSNKFTMDIPTQLLLNKPNTPKQLLLNRPNELRNHKKFGNYAIIVDNGKIIIGNLSEFRKKHYIMLTNPELSILLSFIKDYNFFIYVSEEINRFFRFENMKRLKSKIKEIHKAFVKDAMNVNNSLKIRDTVDVFDLFESKMNKAIENMDRLRKHRLFEDLKSDEEINKIFNDILQLTTFVSKSFTDFMSLITNKMYRVSPNFHKIVKDYDELEDFIVSMRSNYYTSDTIIINVRDVCNPKYIDFNKFIIAKNKSYMMLKINEKEYRLYRISGILNAKFTISDKLDGLKNMGATYKEVKEGIYHIKFK